MRVRERKFSKTCILAIAAVLSLAAAAEAQTYSGQGFAGSVEVSVVGQPVVTNSVLDTGDLPATGGTVTQSSVGLFVLPGGVLGLGDRTVSTSGVGNSSTTLSSVNSLNVDALGIANLVTAGVITANTSAVCPNTVVTGSSTVANLMVAGSSITVTGDANQLVQVVVPGVATVRVVINEQIVHPGSITVNALHITITALDNLTEIDVIVASARSGINCGIAPVSDLYSGRGTAVRVDQNSLVIPFLSTIVADTGWLPSSGTAPDPPITSTTNGAGVLPPLLTTGTAFSSTEGGDPAGTTASSSQVEDLDILIGPAVLLGPDLLSLTADVVESNTQCQCSLSAPTCTGDSDLVGLTASVLGVPLINIPLDFPPNFNLVNLDLPGVLTLVVTVNEQETTSVGVYEAITVNALHVELGVISSLLIDTDIKVAHSHSDIACAIEPSAAGVTLSGRVMDPNGRAISRAIVSVTGADGEVRTGRTNTFGYYSIQDLPAGEFYIVSASARGYTFSPRTLSLNDSVSGFDLFPDARRAARAAPAKLHSVRQATAAPAPTYKSEPVMYRSEVRFDSEIYPTRRLKILQ